KRLGRAADGQGQRLALRPALPLAKSRHRVCDEHTGRDSIHRLGRESDQVPFAQAVYRLVQHLARLVGSLPIEDLGHSDLFLSTGIGTGSPLVPEEPVLYKAHEQATRQGGERQSRPNVDHPSAGEGFFLEATSISDGVTWRPGRAHESKRPRLA